MNLNRGMQSGCLIYLKDENRLESTVQTLQFCDSNLINLSKILKILATLPVTTASAERSFIALRRHKNYLRNTMTSDRLMLALLKVHSPYFLPSTA